MNPPSSVSTIFLTTGQTARKLRVSISTLKRWLREHSDRFSPRTNAKGWKLFAAEDVESLKRLKLEMRRSGKVYKATTLQPVGD